MKIRPELKIVVSNAPAAPSPQAPPKRVKFPFAVVNGEPISQLPRDLYIPPQALEVFLEAFEGPLDLLLYLIRRQNLNILDIPLAEITRQYMQYIELMQELQLELAGEYLVMAATLAELKSRMLLPRPKLDEDGEEDPRAELVRRPQEYVRFKRAAAGIDALPRLERDVWTTSAQLKERPLLRTLPQIALQGMPGAINDGAVRAQMFAHHHIQRERLSVGERMSEILAALGGSAGFVPFQQLFRPQEGRMGVTITFAAILELMREGLIDIVQARAYAPLHVRAANPGPMLRVVTDNTEAAAPAGEAAPDTRLPARADEYSHE